MNYIYDILLNFNNEIYEFYDWNKTDKLNHIKKIPIFKVDSYKLFEIKNNVVEFNHEFIEKINNKTDEFTNKKNKSSITACLLTDGLEVLALKFQKEILYSRLLIDEEIDTIEISKKLDKYDIAYTIKKNKEIEIFKTRKEIEMSKYVNKELDKIIKNNNSDELRYLYYECFNEKQDSIDEIITSFNRKLENGIILNKIYEFLKLKNV